MAWYAVKGVPKMQGVESRIVCGARCCQQCVVVSVLVRLAWQC